MKFQFLKIILLIILISLPAYLRSTTANGRGSSIIIDGNSSDFTADESLLGASEPDNDSVKPPNELYDIKATWDASYLYLAVDCRFKDKGVIIYIATDYPGVMNTSGMSDASQLNSWKRELFFTDTKFKPNYFIAAWSTGAPQLWGVQYNSFTFSYSAAQETSDTYFTAASGIDQFAGRSIEMKIPWDFFFGLGDGKVNKDATIRIAAALVGNDGENAFDIAPDNSSGISGRYTYTPIGIDNYLKLTIDTGPTGGDNIPDYGVSPANNVLVKYPVPIAAKQLSISNLTISPNPFSPNGDGKDDAAVFSFILSGAAHTTIEIYDILANKVFDTSMDLSSGANSVSWNGYDSNGNIAGTGIYILLLKINDEEVYKKGFALIK